MPRLYKGKIPIMLQTERHFFAPGRVNLMGRHVEHRGGGINVRSGDVTLKDVKIENNCASMYGGGIACRTLVSRAALNG